MYLDSAYVLKFYLNEADAPRVRSVIATADSLFTTAWAIAEVSCALHRKLRERQIDRAQHQEVLAAFLQHADDGLWTFVPVTDRVLRKLAATLAVIPTSVYLRSGDAVHLATAADLGQREIWTSDRHLLTPAPHFGLIGRSA